MKTLVAAVLVLLTLTGCSGAVEAGSSSAHPHASSTPVIEAALPRSTGDPLRLIGVWTISSGGGEDRGRRLTISPGHFQITRPCGAISAFVAVSRIGLLPMVDGFSESCWDHVTAPTASWMDDIDGYRVTPAGVELLARDSVAASLTPILGVPDAPTVNAFAHAWVASPVRKPSGLRAASAGELIGRWIPLGDFFQGDNDAVTIDAAGTWTGISSCHTNGGRWLAGSDGEILTSVGAEYLNGCGGSGDSTWLGSARFAGFADRALVLQNAAGVEIGRLVRP